MLRYRRIHQHFLDTLFASKNAGKSSRGYTCMQLFVTYKGFIHVVPIKSRSELSKAMKMFAKEIGSRDVFVCDADRAKISDEVKQFLHKIGSSLPILEEGTPWENRAEL